MKKVVVVKLIGGLGNQMFQYAAGRSASLRLKVPLVLDLSWFGVDPNRKFSLSPFKIEAVIDKSTINLYSSKNFIEISLKKALYKINTSFFKQNLFKESGFDYDKSFLTVMAPLILNGYFQSEKYFKSISNVIKTDFSFNYDISVKAREIFNQIKVTDSICLHIRRGDYLTNEKASNFHGICPIEYYQSGLEIVKHGLVNPWCFIFSDDPKWVKDNFKITIPMTIVDIHSSSEAHEDLRLMTACKRFVIANSSLSWWAAWLSNSENKIVIAPIHWFKNKDISTPDLIPNNWIRI